MTVRKQIMLLMSALVVAFIALGLGARAWQERQTLRLAQNALQERKTFVQRIAALQGRDLESYVRDTSFWDDLVTAVAQHDEGWGDANFKDSLISFHMTGVWAYDKNRVPAFSSRTPQTATAPCPVPPDALKTLLRGDSPFCHFFVKTEAGVMEVRGATIHPSDDPGHKSAPLGYLFAVRPWDTFAVRELSKLTDSRRISLASGPPARKEIDGVATSDGALQFAIPLADWQGKPLAGLQFTANSDAVQAARASVNGSAVLFAGFATALLTLLFLCLLRWVSSPLAALSACLRREEPEAVSALTGARTEFGEIARLMQNFFAQQRALSDAHDQMEARVNERTIALVGVNIALKGELAERQRVEAEREQALTAWKESQQRFESLVRNASDMVTIIGTCGDLQYVSPASQRMLCAPPDTLYGLPFFSLVHGEDRATFEALFRECAATPGISLTCEVRLHCSPSERADQNDNAPNEAGHCACEAILHNLAFEPGVNGIVATFHDITERKAFERELAHQAFHDVLTGLPNRALFMERLGHALERARRRKDDPSSGVAVLFLDLDNFKYVNDSLGHEAGDRLLVGVTQRLQASVRPGDTVARQGGDEFTLLLEDIGGVDDARAIASEVARALLLPLSVDGRDVFTTGSVGIAVSRDGSDLPENLLRDADTAMYQAKNHGKARWEVFDRTMNARVIERLEMETMLRRALENKEFQVHYQPIVNLATGRIVEVEALARWVHPERGLIAPEQFIPLAEENGLIVPLGRWVLGQACAQVRDWQKQFPLLDRTFTVGVNLSARQFQEADLVEQITNALHASDLSPDCLKVEITETMMMNADATVDMLRLLRSLGIRVAVDDFGTGYSSMSYLSSLPIDTLKIDKSFVARLGQNAEQEAIVRAVISLGKALHLSVTGEGIETEEHRARLCALGCDLGQGYLFSRPLAPPAIAHLLAAQERFPAVAAPLIAVPPRPALLAA